MPGQDVKTGVQCWDEDETSKTWMRKAGLNSSETYVHFVNRNVNISLEQGKLAIAWDDAWKDYGTALHPQTTWMFWTSNAVNGERAMQKAAASEMGTPPSAAKVAWETGKSCVVVAPAICLSSARERASVWVGRIGSSPVKVAPLGLGVGARELALEQ